jgi:hypothetical protein
MGDRIDQIVDRNVARDARRHRWNHALATGDPAVIDRTRDELLGEVFTGIMDDDPCYALAGWKPTG